MNRNSIPVLLCLVAASFLSACGGGSGGGTTTVPSAVPAVSAVTADSVMYKKSAVFTVTGENLDQGISASASGACTSLSEQPGGTAVSRSYTCVPQTVGPLNVTISATTGGTVLKQANVTVPFPQVTLQTSKGTVIVELRPDKAPKTVDNFLQYVNDGFYDNTIFHRVISGFVVQGGGEGTDQVLKTTRAAIPLEAPATTGLSNITGTIAMARTSVGLDTATSQFFINTVSNTALDTASGGYAVFGSVIQGMSVVKEIEAVPVVDTTNYVPVTMVTVTSARQTNTINVTLPTAPAGVAASGGANQASISWNSVPGATSYNVYWSTTPGVTTTNGSKAKTTATAVSHRPLLANTTYYYIITAENSAGESAPSSQVSATTSTLDGVALYSANCASCHNALASSTKKGKTAAQIQAAITANTGNMGTLSTLTAAQIQAIANVL